MTEMMTAKVREVSNGFILEVDGFVGSKEILCDSIQSVTKELLGYYQEHETSWNSERVKRVK